MISESYIYKGLIILFVLIVPSKALYNDTGISDFINNGVHKVCFVNRGIHTGMHIPVERISVSVIKAMHLFSDRKYVDIGWGDAVVYRASDADICMDIKAVTMSEGSVIRITSDYVEIDELVTRSDFAVQLTFNDDDFYKLCSYINDSFVFDESGEPVIVSSGIFKDIYFKSWMHYNLFNTCNTWDISALKHAGVDVSGCRVITAGQLYARIKKRGVVLKPDY